MAEETKRVYHFEPGGGFKPVSTISEPDEASQEDESGGADDQGSGDDPTKTITNNDDSQGTDDQTGQDDDQGSGGDDSGQDDDQGGGEGDQGGQEDITGQDDDDQGADDDDDQGAGQDDAGDDGQEDVITDNFFVAAAQAMVERGELPEDFQLPENADDATASDAIYEAYKSGQKESVFSELLNEFQSEMQKNGYTQEHLQYAKMLANKIEPEAIKQIINYKELSQANVEDFSEEDKAEYVETYLKDKGFNSKHIKKVLDSTEADGDIDDLFEEGKVYYGEKEQEQTNLQLQQAKQNELYNQQLANYRQQVISTVFKDKKIGNDVLSEDELDHLEDALYERSIPVQYQGQVYNITPFEQFNAALDNDFAYRLWAFKKFIFQESDKEKFEAAAQKRAEEAQVLKWGKKTRTKKARAKQPGSSEIQVPKDGTAYIYEDGQYKKIQKKN